MNDRDHLVTLADVPAPAEDLATISALSIVKGRGWLLFVVDPKAPGDECDVINVHTTLTPAEVLDLMSQFAEATSPGAALRRQFGGG